MPFPYTFPIIFTAFIFSADAGAGVETSILHNNAFNQDAGSGTDGISILTGKAGSDIRLQPRHGKVNISHKEVNL